jgi:hypothetical protein
MGYQVAATALNCGTTGRGMKMASLNCTSELTEENSRRIQCSKTSKFVRPLDLYLNTAGAFVCPGGYTRYRILPKKEILTRACLICTFIHRQLCQALVG